MTTVATIISLWLIVGLVVGIAIGKTIALGDQDL
jgi:hypothetical protein